MVRTMDTIVEEEEEEEEDEKMGMNEECISEEKAKLEDEPNWMTVSSKLEKKRKKLKRRWNVRWKHHGRGKY